MEMVDIETEKAFSAGIKDNLFLRRYAASVTSNGETVNVEDATSTGFGAWRLTEDQYDEIITNGNSNRRSNVRSDDITANLIHNANVSFKMRYHITDMYH